MWPVGDPAQPGSDVSGGITRGRTPASIRWRIRCATSLLSIVCFSLVAAGHTTAVVQGAAATLRDGGALVLEIHAAGADAAAELLSAHGFREIQVTRDLTGRDRVAEGVLR